MNKKFYQMYVDDASKTAVIDIYGDITSCAEIANEYFGTGDYSAHMLSKQLEELEGIGRIEVNINSYGGEVAEGLAIYNALKRNPAHVVTRVDGFACSIASVIFMAGDEREMNAASLLMIHNAWSTVEGDAAALRKFADDLETITGASKAAYMEHVSISEEELTALMDIETWISPTDAMEMGFCSAIVEGSASQRPAQSSKVRVMAKLAEVLASAKRKKDEPKCEEPDEAEPEPEPDPEEPQEPEEPQQPQEPEEPHEPEEPENEPEQKPEPKAAVRNLAAFLMSK